MLGGDVMSHALKERFGQFDWVQRSWIFLHVGLEQGADQLYISLLRATQVKGSIRPIPLERRSLQWWPDCRRKLPVFSCSIFCTEFESKEHAFPFESKGHAFPRKRPPHRNGRLGGRAVLPTGWPGPAYVEKRETHGSGSVRICAPDWGAVRITTRPHPSTPFSATRGRTGRTSV
jgi:hypothetical protein